MNVDIPIAEQPEAEAAMENNGWERQVTTTVIFFLS